MPRIRNSSISELIEHIDMKAIVENYVKLERKGDKWWGCCPFHGEATPSFNIDTEKKVYYCFGCGKGGSAINFVMELEKLNFPEAIEFIAKKIGFRLQYEEDGKHDVVENDKKAIVDLYSKIVILFHSILVSYPQGKDALKYLEARGITRETIDKFQLGFAPKERVWLYNFLIKKSYTPQFLAKTGLFSSKYNNISFFSNRIMFPIFDRYGAPIAFGGRLFAGEGAKYLNTKDMEQYKKGNSLFAFSFAMKGIREKNSVVLCEGYMDVISYHQAGISNAVAPLGTALTEDQVKILKNLTDVFYLSFDSDEAGQKATYKAILMIRQFNGEVRVINIKSGKDPAEILQKEGDNALSLLLESATMDVEYLLQIASNKFNVTTSNGKIQAISFLFPYIKSLTSTVYKEEVIKRFSIFFHVMETSILSDYERYLKEGIAFRAKNEVQQKIISIPLIKTAEMRLLLSVVANRELFIQLRSEVRLEDFEDVTAKQLYIALEECFREGRETYDDLIGKCENSELKKIITQVINTDEFSKENSENILEDGIKLINLNKLKKRRQNVVNRLHVLSLNNSDDREVQDLLMEKKELDSQISSVK
ncbi:MAG: DNA primase [Treponema sp.]